MAFSPDGKTVLIEGPDKCTRLWDAGIAKPIGSELELQGIPSVATFSPDGKAVLVGDSGFVKLWDANTSMPVGRSLEHAGTAKSASFSPDGRTILIGYSDNTARYWDAATCMAIGPPLPHQGSVNSVSFSPDGRFALTADGTNYASLWLLPRELTDEFEEVSSWVESVTAMAVDDKGDLYAIDPENWQRRRSRLQRPGSPLQLGSR